MNQGTVFGKAINDYFKDNGSTEYSLDVPLYYRTQIYSLKSTPTRAPLMLLSNLQIIIIGL